VASKGRGDGSCFTLRFPLVDAGPEPEPTELPASGSVEARKVLRRVLVVDDDADTAVALAMLLRTYGHHARKAHDGATALAVLASYEADVVTTDQNLPDGDGASLAREIRARLGRPIRLLCISGATPEAGFGADVFDQVLVKPVDPKHLLAIVGRPDVVDIDRKSVV